MVENFINLFQYLKKENLTIDKNEFLFQYLKDELMSEMNGSMP